ncbi:NAD-dependent protein deacetylase sirtuin-3 isoform X2 [Takifugu rubripes]|nr:NAD-dependent protein deacetylase sirtuin-3-like isoform X2 [Takifugu rubripes]XP_029697889.1 NAD-dependent protein deacetylase sirtuin-3-like isoform X2 [Takifugu rubripes]XP_056907574.1 NAD-dependent protein deacetylase sirtuin-3 isoform X2 [Takifugu flavidus]XP_056907575.1 NAD-dependent protein deacetylase sirtuin-3 isoform X2 [Takifugu flavidus]XP_056907576.1 NAD-dependent protein deacetylase sirtuin-3 isoform X2 [Takifugu flavidus]|eukprot:XP_011605469.1 PREDICTED: NAD-dependent protein deacetylase sirtuin-3-like isoform X2 [Takifugu rubripes]
MNKKAPQCTVTRITRSSSSQARHTGPAEALGPEFGLYGKQRKKQTDSTLAQDLSQMSVSRQNSLALGASSSVPAQACRSSGSRSTLGRSRGGLASVARLVKLGRCKNVVVVAGAGISTASGIPDFRTPGTGLYANLEQYNIPYPEAVFNIDFFSNDPLPFFSLAKALYPGSHRPNYIHYFIRVLHHKGLLLRMYTQNIDGLEKLCGIPDDKLVEAHGSFSTASCHLCYTAFPAAEAKAAIMSDKVPLCSFCAATVKPDVVFFGEDLPEKYFLHTKDFPKADLLIIMGTSLQIEPFASLVNTVRSTVPRLLLNRHAVGPFERVPLRRGDHMELGDLVATVRRFAEMLGWDSEIEELMSTQETQSIPVLISSPPSLSSQTHESGSTDSPRKMEARGDGARSNGEESDSETDSKSSASSTLSS